MDEDSQDHDMNGNTAVKNGDDQLDSAVISKFGGRHLIFRTRFGKRSLLPKSYALVSSFSGFDWLFYGVGQLFLTHEALCEFQCWTARIPRSGKSKARFEKLLMQLEPELNSFIGYCNDHGIEGTIVVEANFIEFHWTFGQELQEEKTKSENSSSLEIQFKNLASAFSRESRLLFA